MLPGTGDGAMLKAYGIEVKHHLPGVGANDHDHLAAALILEMSNTESYGISLRTLPRGVANLIHERIWAHLVVELQPLLADGVSLIDREPTREVAVQLETGRTYRLRFKRHSDRDLISSYSTRTDVAFWGGPAAGTLGGMEEVRLAAGYRWNAETRDLGATVVSYREGKSNPIWAVEINAGGAGAAPISWSPASPNLPLVDLERALNADVEGEGGADS